MFDIEIIIHHFILRFVAKFTLSLLDKLSWRAIIHFVSKSPLTYNRKVVGDHGAKGI